MDTDLRYAYMLTVDAIRMLKEMIEIIHAIHQLPEPFDKEFRDLQCLLREQIKVLTMQGGRDPSRIESVLKSGD